MIARLIENWLTNANERGFEVPFCQLLMWEGHRIIHLNRHSPLEQGKDIISLDREGRLCAYQLKAGDISLGRWRDEVHKEAIELIELPVEHPAVTSAHARPFIVTNGRYTEEVIHAINTLNRGNAMRPGPLGRLETVDRAALLKRFIDCHGGFLPQEPRDFEAFLRLFLEDGRDMLPKARFARFVHAQLNPGRFKKRADAVRGIASTLLLGAYALSAYQRADNHFALFEGWVLLAAGVARLAECRHLGNQAWHGSFKLAVGAARAALSNLTAEALADGSPLTRNGMMDGGPPYRARLTLTIGAAATFALIARLRGERFDKRDALDAFIGQHAHNMILWGESAVPFFIAIALWLERCAQALRAESLVEEIIRAITANNSPNSSQGLPGPYHGVNRCVAAMCDVAANPMRRDSPLGSSFTLDALVAFLVRRMRKQSLKLLWKGVTYLHMSEMDYAVPQDIYLWRTRRGHLTQRYVARPQQWSALVERAAERAESTFPSTLRVHREFALMFLLVYPHRFGRGLLRLAEQAASMEPPLAGDMAPSSSRRARHRKGMS